MPRGKTLLVILLLLISSTSGCLFFKKTNFSLLSIVVDDDNGFPLLRVSFNTSDTTVLTLISPQHTTVFSDTYYYGVHAESILLDEYRMIPNPGTYLLKAVDAQKNTIYENKLTLHGANLSFSSISDEWWTQESSQSIIGFQIRVKNTGDLPAYPTNVIVTSPTVFIRASLLPTVVLPLQSKELTCFVYLEDLSEETLLSFSLTDNNGEVITRINHTVVPSNMVSSWEYHWHYQGQNTLQIPGVDWFYDFYKNKKRLDLTDYAAYIFEPYDDAYITLVADRLLSLASVTNDLQKINFIASFVQSLEYAKDNQLNESYEYPRYPLETLKDQRGDCEDKAILTAALLTSLGYNVSLIRLPNHMAIGVALNQTLPLYTYYIDQYYFLETTSLHTPLGKVPSEYQDLTNLTVYPISSRPLLLHSWKNATSYKLSTGGDYVKIKLVIENLGAAPAQNVTLQGAFYDHENRSYNKKTMDIPSLAGGTKRIVELVVTIPPSVSTTLKTQVFIEDVMVHQRESTSQFP